MSQYNMEIKAAAVSRMQPPRNQSVPQIAREMNIPQATLYSWRAQAKRQGQLMPHSQHNDWDAASKLNCIISCATLNQAELSAFCREKGLFPEQIDEWKAQLMSQLSSAPSREEQRVVKQLSNTIKQLQSEIQRKDKALAESAALLVLSKKYRTLLAGEDE